MDRMERTLSRIQSLDQRWFEWAKSDLDSLTKPPRSLGRLEEMAQRIVAIREDRQPRVGRKVIFTMAGDHGVVAEGVSAFPQAVTPQMVLNFLHGGAAINVLAQHVGAEVIISDIGVATDLAPHPQLHISKVGYGTQNMARGPAMTREQAVQCICSGMELFEEAHRDRPISLVGTGEMGIGNTTPSSAIVSVFTGEPADQVTGLGTGIDDRTWARKVRVVEQAISINRPDPADALDVLTKVGGFEIGAIAGTVLAGATHRVPVVIDGFISTAGALVAAALKPEVTQYLFAGHRSVEVGHRVALQKLGLRPVLDMDLRLGEGTGAVLAMSVLDAAVKILTEMATFEDAGVSGKL